MDTDKIQLYEEQPIRAAWVEDEEEWYFSIVDVVQVLTESADGRKYLNKLKQRLNEEGDIMAFDYKKKYKEFYMPKNKPAIVTVPTMSYIAVRGQGNPN